MKLRMQHNSIRFRLLRSEVASFLETGRVEETITFAASGAGQLIYALQHEASVKDVAVTYTAAGILVRLASEQVRAWAETEQTGIYAKADVGEQGELDVVIEKDFACLDLTDADNVDTFPNPQIGAVC